MTETHSLTGKSRTAMWTILVVLLLGCVAVVVFPIYIIRPFVHQSAGPLKLALMVKRWAPWFTLLASLAGAVVMVRAWARRGETGGER
jgi:Na+-driven multidrug efflux pump